MKRVVLLLSVIMLCASAMYAQTLLLNENFDYGATANAEFISVTTNWARHSGNQGPQYSNQSLSYSGYPSSNVGGAISFTYSSTGVNDGDVNRLFTDITTSSTIYASFLINLSSAKSATDYFFHLGQNPFSTSVFRGKVFAIANGSGWNIGVSKMATSAPTMNTNTILEFNKTYLVVVKYNFNTASASDDVVSLYVYADTMPTSETSTSLISILNVNDGASDPIDIGAVAIRESGNCPTGIIDGIRVSTNWGLTLTGTATAITKEEGTLPNNFSLSQNYPNPFNPTTRISFSIPEAGNYSVKVFDILGKEVETLVNNEQLSAGKYNVTFNAKNLASGTYIYRLSGNNVNLTSKMLLVK